MKQRNDFRVFEEKDRHDAVVWRIKLGGAKGEVVTTCRSEEQANEYARQLNIDPYYFDRGQTRAERNQRIDDYNKSQLK